MVLLPLLTILSQAGFDQRPLTGSLSHRTSTPDLAIPSAGEVWVVKTDCTHAERSIAGDDGQFRLPSLPLGEYNVYANARGFVSSTQRVEISSAAPAFVKVDLKVSASDSGGSPPSRPWRGRIVNAKGQPIAEAQVEFRGRGGLNTAAAALFTSDTKTDRRGSFCLPRTTGERGELHVTAPGFRTRVLKVRYSGSPDPVELRLRPR